MDNEQLISKSDTLTDYKSVLNFIEDKSSNAIEECFFLDEKLTKQFIDILPKISKISLELLLKSANISQKTYNIAQGGYIANQILNSNFTTKDSKKMDRESITETLQYGICYMNKVEMKKISNALLSKIPKFSNTNIANVIDYAIRDLADICKVKINIKLRPGFKNKSRKQQIMHIFNIVRKQHTTYSFKDIPSSEIKLSEYDNSTQVFENEDNLIDVNVR